MWTNHILLCATVTLLFTATVAQDSSGAPLPPQPPPTPVPPPISAPPPVSAPPPISAPPSPPTVVTTPPPLTTAVTTEPGGSTVGSTTPLGSDSTLPAGTLSATTETSTITSGDGTLPATAITSGDTTLPSTAITSDTMTFPSTAITSDDTTPLTTTGISDGTALPTTTIISNNGAPAAVTGSQSTSNILTVPLPQPTITVVTTQAILPIPTASVAQLPDQRTVNSTEPRIKYQGKNWTQTTSTCDSEVTAMKCQDPSSYVSYRFKALEGGSVFLGSTRSSEAGVYVVTLDGVQTKIDGFTTEAGKGCSCTWSQKNLAAGLHNLTISFVGPSPQSSSQQAASFELNTFQLVAEDTSPPAPPASGGRSLLAEISCAAVFFAVLLHIMSI